MQEGGRAQARGGGGRGAGARCGHSPPGIPGAPAAAKPMPPQIPDVLARVNGEKIERWEFDNAVKRMEARAGGPVPPDKRDEVLRGVLDQLVAFHLLAQESRARKLAVADTDVEARLADIRKSFPTEEAFKQGIAAQGLTLDQLKAQAKIEPRGRQGHRQRGQRRRSRCRIPRSRRSTIRTSSASSRATPCTRRTS